jgi:hypothetical protein
MNSRIAWIFCAAAFAALLWFGCDDEEDKVTPPIRPELSVQIVTGATNDTLWFVHSDSASTTVTIIVIDSRGNARSGQQVNVWLSDSSLGLIEYSDPNLRDTTNTHGRVNAVYRSFAREGDQIITATAGGWTSNRVLVIRQLPQGIATVTFETDCDSIIADPNGPDSCEICVTLRDAANHPIPDVSFNVSATGGRLTIPQPTDSNGRSCFYWFIREGSFGEYCFYIANDSICFSIPELVDPFTLNIYAEPVHLIACPTDTVQTLVTIDVQDGLGNRVRNDSVRVFTTGGTIPQNVLTDSVGYCQFPWTFHDEFGEFQLFVRYERCGLRDTLNMTVTHCDSIAAN